MTPPERARFGRLDRPPPSFPRRLVNRVFRNPATGRLAVIQPPNLPLGIFLAATAVRLVLGPAGAWGTAVAVVAGVALVWWAGDEVVRGESLFRRLLGGAVLVALAVGQLMR